MNTITKIYVKGSEWRKWDLHIHAPSKYTCAKNDQYVGQNLDEKQQKFIEELKEVIDISVLGITDYFSLDSYKMVIDQKANLPNFQLILPNIELRITPVTSDNRKINLHIIPNTEVLTIDEIERFLYKFEFGPEKYTCQEADLIKLGKKSNPSISDEEAFKKGLNDFSISYDCFFKEYNNLPEKLKENILVGVSNNSGDGASGIKDIQSIREIIYSGVHFLFSAQPSDRAYFLGDGVDNKEKIKQKYGSLKPCIHGSDYHGSKDGKTICIPDLNRFCWIKADPTFEGLKQIKYEPKDRISINANKPEEKSGYQIIDRIEITSDLVFNTNIFFNSNLNSIIGGRSSGKSVLLGAIAKKVKSTRRIELYDSEYEKFVQSVSDNIKVVWKDEQEENDREVEYFEQGYMYKIARDKSQLNKIVNNILIQKGKEAILEDYKKFITENSKNISSLVSDYYRLLQEILDNDQKARDKGDKKGIEEEIAKLKEEQKGLSATSISVEDTQKYEEVKKQLIENENNVQLLSNDNELLGKLESVSLFKDNIDFELISFSDSQKEKLSIVIGEIKVDADKRWKREIGNLIQTCNDQRGQLNQRNIESKKNEIYLKVLQAYKDNDQLSEYDRRIKMQMNKLFEITTILAQIGNLKRQLEQTREKIKAAHQSFYDRILEVIPQLSDTKDGLEIKAKWKFEAEKFKTILSSGLNLQGYTNQSLANYQFDSFDSFVKHQFKLFEELEKSKLTLKGGYDNQGLSTLLISTNFLSLNYDIEYEGDDFKKMSDGKKAFVVLKLLLDFSDKDCPILIDQPEDDLDNRAIYNDLVQYLRRKKKLRQIIVATHNPNIVVGADSELVICANQHGEKNFNNEEKKFQYVAGSLEHTFPRINGKLEILECQGTREHVCEVLEGGNIAFKLREKKYSIKE